MHTHTLSFCTFLFNKKGCLSTGVFAFGVAGTKEKAKTEDTAESKCKNSGARKALVGNLGLSQTPLLRTLALSLCMSAMSPSYRSPPAQTRMLQAWAAYLFSPSLTCYLTSFNLVLLSPSPK